MSFTDVDRVNGRTIRKLHSPDKLKCFGYLSGIRDDKNNLSEVAKHGTLTEARNFCGFQCPDTGKKTAPKSSYAQNRPGYDPHDGKRAKG